MEIVLRLKAKWQIKGKEYYVWTECKRLYNLKTGRFIKKTLHGLTPGYWIGKDFIKLNDLKKVVEQIPKSEQLPF